MHRAFEVSKSQAEITDDITRAISSSITQDKLYNWPTVINHVFVCVCVCVCVCVRVYVSLRERAENIQCNRRNLRTHWVHWNIHNSHTVIQEDRGKKENIDV